MKKLIALLLCVVLIGLVAVGCDKTPVSTPDDGNESSSESTSEKDTEDSTSDTEEESSEESTSDVMDSVPNTDEFGAGYVSALKFTTAPTFDGVITEAEWGAPTVVFNGDQEQSYQHNNTGRVELNASLWLRWDETYLYIGVTSNDPDGLCLAPVDDFWNGDTLQFRIDPNGGNSTADHLKPFPDDVLSVNFGPYNNEGGLMNYEWHITENNTLDALFGFTLQDEVATWEIAVKHSEICLNYTDLLDDIKDGFEYGMTVVRLNGAPGQGYNTWLSWGSGICAPQPDYMCVGSNHVILSDEVAVK